MPVHGELNQTVKIGLQPRFERLVGVVVKAAVLPKVINRGGYAVLSATSTAQIGPIAVPDLLGRKLVRSVSKLHWGLVSRPGKGASVRNGGVGPRRTDHGGEC